MMNETVFRRLPVKYTADELAAFGEKLANDQIRLRSLEDEKADSAKGFKKLIDDICDEMDRSAAAICDKQHFADIECAVAFNSPELGRKRFYRLDNGEVAGGEPMEKEDFQQQMEFESPAVSIQFGDGEEIPLPDGFGPVIGKLRGAG